MKKTNQYKLVNGQLVPGVTTIVDIVRKYGLESWLSKNPKEYTDRISKESKDYGTRIHEIIQADWEGQIQKLDNEEKTILENYHKVTKDWDIQEMEKSLVSEKYGFGGTLDIVAKIEGKKTIVDIKTSKAIFREVYLQLAGYQMLYPQAERCKILRLDKKRLSWELLNVETKGLDKVFLACKTIWEFMNKK